jgi:hypothetical protein
MQLHTRRLVAFSIAASLFMLTGCNNAAKAHEGGLTVPDARAIAKEAYIYGFPMAANYSTMYKQAIDKTGSDYRGPFNEIHSAKSIATPDDKFVVTPNSDTPYSYLWLDLRAEPIVVTMPKIEPNRYYTGQMVDLYTYNFAYLGTRSYGNDGGVFLIAGPGWNGDKPAGVKDVIRSETQLAYILFRTQLFNLPDLPKVNKIQSGYTAQPLSTFLKQPAPPAPPAVNWPKPANIAEAPLPDIFPTLNFLFRFCPPNPSESALLTRFAKLNIGPGQTFDFNKFSPEIQQAINDGVKDSQVDFDALLKRGNADEFSSGDVFGARDFLKDNYLYRYFGARIGLYGNSKQDALYFGYLVDTNHQPLDAAKSSYELRFAKGGLPPNKAFWSLTMYGKTQLLVANPLKRYLLNSTTLKSYKYGSDGSLTFYISHANPGPAKQSNWLPAPDGPFYMIFRVYLPGEAVINGTWKKPGMQPM